MRGGWRQAPGHNPAGVRAESEPEDLLHDLAPGHQRRFAHLFEFHGATPPTELQLFLGGNQRVAGPEYLVFRAVGVPVAVAF